MNTALLTKISKKMSLVLRHNPALIGIVLDPEGWVSTTELINGLKSKNMPVDMAILQQVVTENDKQRFAFNEDFTMIRASQGHSVEVDLGLKESQPPEFLYHGTVNKFLNSIHEKGLLKMNRQHVHLSADIATAVKVGGRRGKPEILVIQSGIMQSDGVKFFRSENGVWLTDFVDPKYISKQ